MTRDPATGPVEAEPAAAAELFGDRIDLARLYCALLAGPGLERGLMGPRERGRLWTRHLLNSAALAEIVADGARVVDIGSGAGLPGIPLALAAPTVHIDLVESLLRRTVFLNEAVAALNLSTQCRVIRARAEEAAGMVGGAEVVTARAVAPLGKLGSWAAPLLRRGGQLLAMKGESAAEEIERDRAELRRAGLVDAELITIGRDDYGTTVVRMVKR